MVGQNIGKYRVLDRVGRGGMGTVYRAIDETLHREVAIKVLNAELNDPEVAKRFRAEAITVARLSHPGIATIYELFQNDGQWLMVMEFVRGETLEHLVDRTGPLAPERSAELCIQALAALAHAHSMGVVHRDLKPANIMIAESGIVKIMDFGIARVAGTEHLTNAGFMMGTPAYMAPEQVIGQEIDARADLYAMGVVFFRLTTAKLPFKGETPFAMAQSQVNDPPTPIATFRPDLPSWVEPVVTRALAKKVDDRFQSAVEFHEALGRCLSGLPMMAAYTSSAPTDVLMTPARAMPTGSLHAPTPAGATSTSSQAVSTEAASVPVSPPPAVPAPAPQGKVVAVPVPAVPARKKSAVGPIAAAVVVILALGAGGFWWKSRVAIPADPPVAAAVEEPAPAPAAPADTTVSPAAPAAAADGSTSAPPAPAATDQAPLAAPKTPAAVSTAPVAAAGLASAAPPSSPTAGASARAARGRTGGAVASTPPPAPVDDTHQAFTNVKLLLITGKKADDEDVLLNFGNGQITVFGRRGGNALATLTYGDVTHATYVHARDPKWDKTLFAPPDDLDVGGMLRTAKDWLVLQTTSSFLVLRLDDTNVRGVLSAVESRTGRPVDRPN